MRYSMPVFLAAVTALGVGASTVGQVINEDLKLLPSDGAAEDRFGFSIAINNGIVAVGAYDDDDSESRSGSAYVFDASTGEQIVKLLPNDGEGGDEFGWSIAIDNGIVAIGARWDDDNGDRSGSAYVFDASTGAQIAKLLPNDGVAKDYFGETIAIDDGVVAVGALYDDPEWWTSGSAYLFDAFTGVQIAKLLPSDGVDRDYFGASIAIDNGVVAVGAYGTGSVYLFDASTGMEIDKLLPNDGDLGDRFGHSVAIDNGIVAVGAPYDDDNGGSSGSAYLFDTSTGEEITKLLASDGVVQDRFGESIAIDNGVVAVGAIRDDEYSGSAYLFNAPTGAQIVKLLASDRAEGDGFGGSIAIDNGVVAVGAVSDDDMGSNSGSAYMFDVGSIATCLELVVDNLIAGQIATFTITRGRVGAKAVTVYGTKPGHVFVNGYAGYCATFGIYGVTKSRAIGGLNRTFDANGEIITKIKIQSNFSGLNVLFQSAQHGTCPDECMSNLVEMVVK